MIMNKRGISPLIATVLIIGFTVALSAVVMTWGTGFVRSTTDQTAKSSQAGIDCSRLNFQVGNPVCDNTGKILQSIEISNNGDRDIKEWIVRISRNAPDGTQVNNLAVEVKGFDVEKLTLTDLPSPTNAPLKVGAIGKIVGSDGQLVTCADTIIERNNPCLA